MLIMQKILIYAASNVKITVPLLLGAHFRPLVQTGCSVFNAANTLPAFLSILIKLTRSHFNIVAFILIYNSLLLISPQHMTIITLSAISNVMKDFASSFCLFEVSTVGPIFTFLKERITKINSITEAFKI